MVALNPTTAKPRGAVRVEECLIAWHLFFARLTPSSPKIDEDYLTVEVSRGKTVSVQILHSKFR